MTDPVEVTSALAGQPLDEQSCHAAAFLHALKYCMNLLQRDFLNPHLIREAFTRESLASSFNLRLVNSLTRSSATCLSCFASFPLSSIRF